MAKSLLETKFPGSGNEADLTDFIDRMVNKAKGLVKPHSFEWDRSGTTYEDVLESIIAESFEKAKKFSGKPTDVDSYKNMIVYTVGRAARDVLGPLKEMQRWERPKPMTDKERKDLAHKIRYVLKAIFSSNVSDGEMDGLLNSLSNLSNEENIEDSLISLVEYIKRKPESVQTKEEFLEALKSRVESHPQRERVKSALRTEEKLSDYFKRSEE
jgi:hypothetical protein